MSSPTISPLESAVEQHIDSTSRLVRKVDLALSLLILLVLLFGGLFLAVLADHWLLKEGLSMPLRLGVFAALAALAGSYIYWKIVPILIYPINPVYTADLIEKDVHTFKNSLINWLLLRQEREEREHIPQAKIHDRMFDGIVKTAAANVQTVPAGHAVDLHKLIVAGTFFTALLILFVVYAALSPKNPLPSVGRLINPFADIERPQAAQFRNVHPGNTTALQGETLTISAEVVSRSAEPVYLVFSTDDGQAVGQRIPMSIPEGGIAHETQFPPGRQGADRGFNSSVDYWIAQGDSRSKQYRIDVFPAASIEIVSLQYDFPGYTGLPSETIEFGGDVRALEGTAVTVAVRSTLPLEKIDLLFDGNPASNVAMRITNAEKTEARGTLTLKHPFPYKTFSFQAMDENGNASRRSGIYRIEVIPDQPPRVQWADTAQHLKEDRISIPLNESLPFPIQAEDPDFALRHLRFKSESPGKRIPDVQFLESPASGPTAHRGAITKTYIFSPLTKRLAVGDSVDVWAEAVDTKLPEGNVSSTRKITINVVEPIQKEEEPVQEQTDEEGEEQPKGGEKQANDSGTDAGGPDEPGGDQGNGDNESEGQGDEGQGGEGQGSEGQGDEGQGDEGQGDEGQGDEGQGDEGQGSEGQGSEGQGSEGQGSEGQGREGQGSEGQGGEGQGSEGQGSEGQGSEGQGSEGQGSEGQGSEGQGSEGQGSEGQGSEGQGSEGQGSEGQGSEGQGGQEQNNPLNPETQDGDAMERIVEQMKREGKFDENSLNQNQPNREQNRGQDASCPSCGAPNQHGNHCTACNSPMGSGQRQQNDALNPNSPNRNNTGNDPRNPGDSNQPSDGERGQGTEPGLGQGTESGQGQGTESEQGQGTESGQGQGTEPGQGQGTEPGQGQGTEPGQGQGAEPGQGQGAEPGQGQGTEPGQGQGTEPGQGQGAEPGAASQGGDESGGAGERMGGTGGGTGAAQNTTPDDPNLQHADQVANMVLEYLEDQLHDKPNAELLKQLGWSEEQLRQFYDRWKTMSENSKQPQQQEGRNIWEDALRSWGLRPNQDRAGIRDSQTGTQDERRVNEALRREPPASLRNRFEGYNRSIGQ